MSSRSDTPKRPAKARRSSGALTTEERAAMRELVHERKAAARGEDDERAVLAKIAEMDGTDRAMAQRLHEIVKESAPSLSPRTWYGMPAYARDGKVVCFFQSAAKFKARYATLGFSDRANLDEGGMWPTYFALEKLTPAQERRIAELIERAAG